MLKKSVTRCQKRTDYLSWDEYFMAVALLSAQRSKDPNTQVGACIINRENKIVGVGYNGFPIGCSDDKLPWDRKGDFLATKYPYVCHAELNAILNSIPGNLKNCSIYTVLFPCNECAKLIIQAGISRVVSPLPEKNGRWGEAHQLTCEMFYEAGVEKEFVSG